MRFMPGKDVGGTLGRLIACVRGTRQLRLGQNASVAGSIGEGILSGLSSLPHPESVADIRFGTTVAANTLVERKGATARFLTTTRIRDDRSIRRGNRKFHHDMRRVKPKAFAPRRRCVALRERTDASARVAKPLDRARDRTRERQMKEIPEIKALGVMPLVSHLNPGHERWRQATFTEEGAGLSVFISDDALPKWREHERSSTTLADTYIELAVNEHLREMRWRFAEAGAGE